MRKSFEYRTYSDEDVEEQKAKYRISGPTRNQVSAGTVDVKIFMDAFYDVNKLSTISPKIISDKMYNIKSGMSVSDEFWERRQIALKDLRGLLISGASEYAEFEILLRGIQQQLGQCIQDLRSIIVRESCITVSFLAQEFGKRFENSAIYLLPMIISLISNSVKVISSSGFTALTFFFKHIQSQRLLVILINNSNNKSNIVRRLCFDLIHRVMQSWPNQLLEKCLEMLVPCISKGVIDADLEAREHSRKAFWVLDDKFKQNANKLYLTFDAKTVKYLKKSKNSSSFQAFQVPQNSIKRSLSCNQSTGSISRRIPLSSKYTSRLHKAAESDDESSPIKYRSARKDNAISKCHSQSTFELSRPHCRRSSSNHSLIPQYVSSHMDMSSRSTSPSSSGSLEAKLKPLPLKVPVKKLKSLANDQKYSKILSQHNPVDLNISSPFKSGGPVRRSFVSNNNNTDILCSENLKPSYPCLSTVEFPKPNSVPNCDVFENIDELQQFVHRTSSENLDDDGCNLVAMEEYSDYELEEVLNDEQELDMILFKLSSGDKLLITLERLTDFLQTDSTFLWMNHTSFLLNSLISILNPQTAPDWDAIRQASYVLQIMLQRQPNCIHNQSEILASTILQSFKTENRRLVAVAMEVSAIIVQIMTLEKWLKLLLPHISSNKDKSLRSGALYMLDEIIKAQTDIVTLQEFLPTLVPPLIIGFQDSQSVIRKNCCSVLVSLYLKIGDELNIHTNILPRIQKKMLELYIKRARQTESEISNGTNTPLSFQ